MLYAYPAYKLLEIESNDIKAWSYYGQYVADKIRGGVALQQYRKNGQVLIQQQAIFYLTQALQHWKDYTNTMEKYNVSVMPYQFDPEFFFKKHVKDAEKDIEIAKKG